jgi:hypothetical protein
VTKDTEQRKAVVNTAMSLRAPLNVEKFFE